MDLKNEFAERFSIEAPKSHRKWFGENLDTKLDGINEAYKASFGKYLFDIDLGNINQEIRDIQRNMAGGHVDKNKTFDENDKKLSKKFPRAIINKYYINYLQYKEIVENWEPRIHRLWNLRDSNLESRLESRLELLYKRPRIDYRISEYVFKYIVKNILDDPWKIHYLFHYYNSGIDLSFTLLYNKDEETNMYHLKDSEYNNTANTQYDWDDSEEIAGGAHYRFLHLFYRSTELNENIKPKEYANIVYDMIGAYLAERWKITKKNMDEFKVGMDYAYIEKFKYPAPFEYQKYNDYISQSEKENYIKHYGE